MAGGGNGIGSFEHLKEPNGKEAAVPGVWPESEEAAFQAAMKATEERSQKRRESGS